MGLGTGKREEDCNSELRWMTIPKTFTARNSVSSFLWLVMQQNASFNRKLRFSFQISTAKIVFQENKNTSQSQILDCVRKRRSNMIALFAFGWHFPPLCSSKISLNGEQNFGPRISRFNSGKRASHVISELASEEDGQIGK